MECILLAYTEIASAIYETTDQVHLVSQELEGGLRLQTFVAPDGTWTMVLESPKHKGCIVGKGNHFKMIGGDR